MRASSATLMLAGAAAWAATTAGTAGGPAPASSPPVATIGSLDIPRAEFDERARQALSDYRNRSGSEIPPELQPVVRRQILERLIQGRLLVLEAKRQGTMPGDREAEDALRRDPFFNEGGVFNQSRFQTVKSTQPVQFQAALEQARQGLAVRKLTDAVVSRHRPDERELRGRAMRGLERASFEYLALRRLDFNGTYPEPRESDILSDYAEHAAELRRPDRAVLSVLAIKQELSDSVTRNPERLSAWERGLHQRADSVLKVVKGGARFENVAKAFGGPPARVTVSPGSFPSYWHGDDNASRAVFESQPGAMLPMIVPSNPGWLVVRTDEVERAHPARLVEVAKDIRARLRLDRLQHGAERALRAMYEARRDSLRGPAVRLRYALVDTTAFDPGEPAAADLDRFYRGHLADYSTFSSTAGGIVTQPFAEVRGDLRVRWRQERRLELARASAERIHDAWSQDRRDPRLERGLVVREVGPVPADAPVDTGSVGAAITDALQRRGSAPGVDVARYRGGSVVYHLLERLADFLPTFEQAKPRLAEWRAAEEALRDEQAARALFDRDPRQFALGRQVYWSSLLVVTPDIMTVTMTHREVEEYQRRHLDRYSAPEVVHASHILVTPRDASREADAAAHARADSLLARIRKGEDFARLARDWSDDEATRDQGGDLGEFGRGAMLHEFERAAFAMQPGDVSDVIRTEVGYHIIRCQEHLPPVVQPLALMYPNVSSDLAADKADSAAARRADSLRRVLRTPAQARAAAARLKLSVIPYHQAIGESGGEDESAETFIRKLGRLKPGEFYPGVTYDRGKGYFISWLDSLTAPVAPIWEEARARALDSYRRGAAERALDVKRVELDSMLSAGWSFDSLATLFGGLEQAVDANLSTKLPLLGARNLDSLVFGTRVPARLKLGEVSGWVAFPAGQARLRVTERAEPNPAQLAARLESERRLAQARVLESYFEDLKKRFPVRILDRELREVMLPPVPEEGTQ